MIYLLAASLLWAFSFGLIKGQLAGVDPVLVSAARLFLAALAFSPFLTGQRLRFSQVLTIMGLGGVQFGLMYVLYIASFQYLPAWLVALFTVMTPLYVVLLGGIRDRKIPVRYWVAVCLAIAGAMVVVARGLPSGAGWKGIALLQGANLCFAVGQVFFRDLKIKLAIGDGSLVAWMYVGAVLVPIVALFASGGVPGDYPHGGQLLVLLYLGVVPTALGFYLWNKGSALVPSGFLAGANNLKVPLAVIVSWTVFGEEADYLRVTVGLVLVVAALFVAGPGSGVIPKIVSKKY